MSERVALVTGAGRGIGQAIVLALAERGWDVVINYRGNIEAARATAQRVAQRHSRALLAQADVGREADRQRLVNETLRQFGRLDLLVNNAGIAPRQRQDLLE
ncbi:MAG TPA: SDR family NAD(P)-dependent oxidoreductase, partial [Anaerolineae bacterium]|nr:SDR family NAD(P)-dependent oxidoreductase [Anaerolineae bacterium]